MNLFKSAWRCVALFVSFSTIATAAPFYSIGNSLTWDALRHYDGDYQHTINCNQNLQRIFEHPEQTCLGSQPEAVRWDVALSDNSYDFVTVQPFVGTSLAEDTAAISHWMTLQPNARFIIHTGWTGVGDRESQYNAAFDPDELSYGPAYFDALENNLRVAFPGRNIGSTNVIGSLDQIAEDIGNGIGPFSSVATLYRDPVHFNTTGQYLATHSFYRAMGIAPSVSGYEGLSLETRSYLDSVITNNVQTVPEPASLAFPIAFLACIFSRRKSR